MLPHKAFTHPSVLTDLYPDFTLDSVNAKMRTWPGWSQLEDLEGLTLISTLTLIISGSAASRALGLYQTLISTLTLTLGN